MKKRLWSMTAAGLLAFALLPSCAPTAPSPSGAASPSPSAAEATATPVPTPTPSMAENTPAPVEPADTPVPTAAPLDFSQEPPLDEYSASIAVPDFLTEEQQDLYRRAHCLYLNLFGVTTANLDRLGEAQNGYSDGGTVVIDDMTYTLSHGRYRKWEDFDAMVHAVFTERFWEERNNSVSAVGETWILFREYNGMLCYLETEKGQGYFYNENVPDEFRIEEKTDNEIKFTLIGHYYDAWPIQQTNEYPSYDYTLEFPIKMVLTEDGWRFDEFHSGLVDEDDPRGQLIELDKVSYVDRLLGFSMDFPESWRGKLEVEQNYDINQSGRSCIVFYHKPSREVFPGGVLFSIDCCPGVWTEEAPPIPAGWSALVLQTERYTFFFRTPSDVQWCEGNEELTRDYKALEADFEYVRSHIASISASSTAEPTAAPASTTATLDFAQEPPLDEFSASIAVPDFLTGEQQDLYRRAHCLYQNMFGGFTAAIDFNFPAVENVEWEEPDEDSFVLGDWPYQPAQGRYQRWADFDATVHGVFTDRFWESKNILSDRLPVYRDFNGRLGLREFERGSGYYYNDNFPDEFRLEKQAEEEISFTLIGHYSWKWPKEGETYEERDARLEREYDQTEEFPIRMVLTENGWRFDEFHAALADEPDTIEKAEAIYQGTGPRLIAAALLFMICFSQW